MIIEAAAATVLTTVATTLTEKVKEKVDASLKDHLNNGTDLSNSLTSYAKALTVQSRAYIDGAIAADPVVSDTLKTCHNIYASLVMAALQLNQYVSKTERVRDLIGVVATEGFNDTFVDIGLAVESIAGGPNAKPNVNHNTLYTGTNTSNNAPAQKQAANTPAVPDGVKINTATGEIVSFDGDNHIPTGKVIKVSLSHPDNPKNVITLNMQVVVRPYLLPNNVALAFLTKDAIPSFFQRWMQWRAGEISFWADLIFNLDQIQKRDKAIRDDKTGLLAEAAADQRKKAAKTAANLAKADGSRSRNIANSIMIYSKDTVARAKAETGFDLWNKNDRERYFAMSFCMFLVIIDPAFNQVTMFFNGVDTYGTYTFDQMKVGSKGNSTADVVAILQALGQGKPPRF